METSLSTTSSLINYVNDILTDNPIVICNYIKVESLTASRSNNNRSAEPSDALRVVNAMLTQIDQIKELVCVSEYICVYIYVCVRVCINGNP